MVDDFSTQFGSPKAGQTATVKTTGPANHEVEKIRGAALTITFTVERVDRIIPAPTGQIVAAFGMTDEAQLKEAIKGRLQQRAEVQQQVAMRSQIAQHLIDQTTMELPQRLTASQAARTLESRRMELMYRGVDAMQIEEHLSELRAASDQQAARELKLFFILNKVAEDLNVSVTEGEMNARIAQMAAERNVRPDKLRQEIIQSNRVGAVFQQIREHKTIDTILAKAKITEMKVDEYNEYAKKQAETAKKK